MSTPPDKKIYLLLPLLSGDLWVLFLFTGGIVISQLLEWLRWHFTDGERLATEILREESPEQHPEYWDCVSHISCLVVENTPKKRQSA